MAFLKAQDERARIACLLKWFVLVPAGYLGPYQVHGLSSKAHCSAHLGLKSQSLDSAFPSSFPQGQDNVLQFSGVRKGVGFILVTWRYRFCGVKYSCLESQASRKRIYPKILHFGQALEPSLPFPSSRWTNVLKRDWGCIVQIFCLYFWVQDFLQNLS